MRQGAVTGRLLLLSIRFARDAADNMHVIRTQKPVPKNVLGCPGKNLAGNRNIKGGFVVDEKKMKNLVTCRHVPRFCGKS